MSAAAADADDAGVRVKIYTDGACSGNPGPGGWGAILIYGDTRREISGGEAHTTNNRMELLAAIEALEALKRALPRRRVHRFANTCARASPPGSTAGRRGAGAPPTRSR